MCIPILRAALLLFCLVSPQVQAGEVHVAVAANFASPAQQIAALFEQRSGHVVKLSVGSTGKLYAQIKNGAPFDVLLAADESIPTQLAREGLADPGFVYANGRLALWSAQPGLVDAQGAVLRRGGYRKLAIADPKLAPYGRAAQQALESLGLWSALQARLVTGESIAQAYQFAASANAELAFVALSQLSGKPQQGSVWPVPANLYSPIRQRAVLLLRAGDKAAASAFLTFLRGDQSAAVIRSFGYDLP